MDKYSITIMSFPIIMAAIFLGIHFYESEPKLLTSLNSGHELVYKSTLSNIFYLRNKEVRVESCLKCHNNIKQFEKLTDSAFTHSILLKPEPIVVPDMSY